MERTTTDPDDLVASSPDRFRDDVARLDAEISRIMAGHSRVLWEGVFWGGTEQRIIGYGDLVQQRSRGEPVEWFVVGLAAQQDHVSLYVNATEDGRYLAETYGPELGDVKVGKAVVTFRSLDRVDVDALLRLVARAAAQVDPTPRPTGELEVAEDGARDLVLRRTFCASAADLWPDVAEPAGLARWYGVVDGDPRAGATVRLRMTAEDGAPADEVDVLACDPPRSFSVDQGGWRVSVALTPRRGRATELELRHRLGPDDEPGDIGPGWEYYLDRLNAARGGPPAKPFDAYVEALRGHYSP
ncbi:SRPBCC domain-containing protein [Cellulosimicrobium cellulans]|uniref:SRPBCC domain-containing protein n=1 Tax=Cellulosimicrobium cellulans TaxID=1710 RepID=UPI0009F4D15B|nr:SRPBCC domain-containing protein [Cellulosimicrobium cellulans]